MQRLLDFDTFSFSWNGETIESPRVDVLEIRYLQVSHILFISSMTFCFSFEVFVKLNLIQVNITEKRRAHFLILSKGA